MHFLYLLKVSTFFNQRCGHSYLYVLYINVNKGRSGFSHYLCKFLHYLYSYISDDDVKVDIFKYGEITEMEYGSRKKGILHTNCTNPMLNVILCEMEERSKSWALVDRFEFFRVSKILNNMCNYNTYVDIHMLNDVPIFFKIEKLYLWNILKLLGWIC